MQAYGSEEGEENRMIREIVHDPLLLAQKSEPAAEKDHRIITDLKDTLNANRDRCAGMAANMIGERKRIIAFFSGPFLIVMVNPLITGKTGAYSAEEGCLSLAGVRPAKRWQEITVRYLDESFRPRTNTFRGFTAQVIQHECDHCEGILI